MENSLFPRRTPTLLLFSPGGLFVVLLFQLASGLKISIDPFTPVASSLFLVLPSILAIFFEMRFGLSVLIALALASSGLSLPLNRRHHADKFVVAK